MKTAKWMAFCVMTVSGIMCVLFYIVPWAVIAFSLHDAASIGILGGADGPTTIFIGKMMIGMVAPGSFLIPATFALSLLSWLLIRFKTKSN